MRPGRQRVRVSVTGARALAALAIVLAVVAVALPLVGGHDYLRRLLSTPEVVVAVSFSVTGALLVDNPRARRVGWLLLAVGVVSGLYTASLSYTAFVLDGDRAASLPPGADLARATAWITSWAWLPPFALVAAVLPQVVPDGRPLSPAWRVPLWATYVLIVAGALGLALAPGDAGLFPGVDNPVAWPALSDAVAPLEPLLLVLLVAVALATVASLLLRVRRADGVERRQVGWVGYAVAIAILVILVGPDLAANVAVLLVPAGIAVAAFRYRLYDLDLVVNRTLVAVLLLGGGALAYAALVAWVGSIAGTSGGAVPFVAAFAVALAFHPARTRLQQWVDRLFFGRRGDPYSLLRDLDRTLREAETPRVALGAAVALVREGLRLTGTEVVVALPSGSEVRERAGVVDGGVVVPLLLHGQEVGVLRAGGRTGGELGGADLRVLQALAGPLASAAYALRLTGDLEESRRRIVETREDERRRIRRDLHDGLGPQLAGVVMGLDVIRSTLSRGEHGRALELTATVGDQARTAVTDVRRLVRGLRPPVLDDLGLLGALRAGAATVPGGPEVMVTARGEVDGLPAAVEVAAYRIATEAVTNAVRHSAATMIEVVLGREAEVLTVSVQDDGRGFAGGSETGVGLVSMRERAAELGGRCTVESTATGTRVVAELPLGVS